MGSYVQPISFACVIIDGINHPVELISPTPMNRTRINIDYDVRYTATETSIMSKIQDKIAKRWREKVEEELDRFWKGIGANG